MSMCGTCVSIGRTVGTLRMHHQKVSIITGLSTQSHEGASECKLPPRGNMGKGKLRVCLLLAGPSWQAGGPRAATTGHQATSSTRVTLEQPRQGTVALKQPASQRLCTRGMQPARLKDACTCCGDPQLSTILALRAKAGLCPRPIRCGQSKGPVFSVSAQQRELHNVPAIA